MIINIGDTIRDEKGREGVITNIGIATDKMTLPPNKIRPQV